MIKYHIGWFGSPICAWLQFGYALWQMVRNNDVVCLILAAPLSSLYRLWRPQICVIIDETDPRSREFERPWTPTWLSNPRMIGRRVPRFQLTVVEQQGEFIKVEAAYGTYIAFTGGFLRLEAMAQRNEPCGLHYATPVGRTALTYNMSTRQIVDKMLLHAHGFFATKHALLMFSFNETFGTGLLTFLALIPLMLQARGYQNASGFFSLVLCLLDLIRTPLYKLYDRIAYAVVKFVKLYIFRQNRAMYDFFGTFSKRWKYCNNFKGYSYFEKEFVTTKWGVFVDKRNSIVKWSVENATKYNLDPSEYDIWVYGNSASGEPMPNGTHNFISYTTSHKVFVQ